MMPFSETLRRISPVVLMLPVVCFTALLLTYSVNIPWMDDVESFLGFITAFLDAPTLSDKINWLFKPNNEHRILVAKLVTVGMYTLTGEVNFRWLILVAYVFLLGILWLLYRVFKRLNLPSIMFLPVPLLLLQPQHHLTSNWAVTGLQHEVTIFLVLAAVYLLARHTTGRFIGAVFLQLLASFSMSNGLFGWVAGAGVLLAQRRFGWLAGWLAIGAWAIWFYFHDFANPQGNETSIDYFLQYPYLTFTGFFTFLGGIFDFTPDAPIFRRSILPTVGGMVLVGIMVYHLWKMVKPWLTNWATTPHQTAECQFFLVGAYGFLIITGAVIAFLRPRFGYNVMLVSNYTLYPALLASLVYLNVLSSAPNGDSLKWRVLTGMAFGTLLWGVMYFERLPVMAERRQRLEAFAFNQKYNGNGLGAMVNTPYGEALRRWMDSAVERGIYQYPTTQVEKHLLQSTGIRDNSIHFDVADGDGAFQVSSFSYSSTLLGGDKSACVIVRSPKHTYLFPVTTLYRPASFYLKRPANGIAAEVLKSALYPGTYQIGLLVYPNETPVRYTPDQLTVH